MKGRSPTWLTVVALLLLLGSAEGAWSARVATRESSPWLFISDIHYDVYAKTTTRANFDGLDTNPQLLDSVLNEARRVDPHPPVVVIAGDFIAHHARRADSGSTMQNLARRFDAAFPHAQFLMTLGNNDSACGDYAPSIGGTFLKDVARAWAPLVDRDGAAPAFTTTFSHDGSYVARLPIAGLRAVVIDDNFFALRYDGKCATPQAPQQTLDHLRSALTSAPGGTRNWVLFHEPPGVDAYSTSHLTHGLFVVPFLRPRSRDELSAILAAPPARVSLVLAGHTHKFSFRIVAGPGGHDVPLLGIPSISPTFGNAPSFLTAPVGPDGTLEDVVQYAYDGARWKRLGDLASLGVPHFEVGALHRLQTELLQGTAHRDAYASMYEGGAKSEIGARTWSVYACAMTHFTDSAFETCTGKRGYSILTRRGLALVVALLVTIVVATIVITRIRRRRAALH